MLSIRAVTDEGEPLTGLPVTVDQVPSGATDGDGRLQVRVRGPEGARVALSVTAPAGYRARAEEPLVLTHVSRVVDGAAREIALERVVRFEPLRREYAVLVDVGAPDLPVETFGLQQAVTNSDGVALFLYPGTPGDELRVQVKSDGHPKLKPKTIASTFILAPRPEAYLVRGRFEPAPPPPRKPPPPRRHKVVLPERL
jgi:hypothetical protein